MENASLSSDVWNDVTRSLSTADDAAQKIAYIRDRVLKAIYIIIGALGVLDNLFVIIVFIMFIKITEKVPISRTFVERTNRLTNSYISQNQNTIKIQNTYMSVKS